MQLSGLIFSASTGCQFCKVGVAAHMTACFRSFAAETISYWCIFVFSHEVRQFLWWWQELNVGGWIAGPLAEWVLGLPPSHEGFRDLGQAVSGPSCNYSAATISLRSVVSESSNKFSLSGWKNSLAGRALTLHAVDQI